MKIAFFGTPEFALPALRRLKASKQKLVGVVTAPPKPQGRGLDVLPSPVAQEAEKLSLPLLQPDNLQDPAFLKALRLWEAEVFAVVAFRILPVEVFSMPRFGSINVHASLLPRYRGAAPIQWALWNGDLETGVTTFQLEKSVDTGNLLKQHRVEILDEDDAGTLSEKLAQAGAEALLETLKELEKGKLNSQPQDPALATSAPKIPKEKWVINWQNKAQEIHNQVRALSPDPCAYTVFDGRVLKILRSEATDAGPALKIGEILIHDQDILVGTGERLLRIRRLQLQGKKEMDTKSFLRGFRVRGKFQIPL